MDPETLKKGVFGIRPNAGVHYDVFDAQFFQLSILGPRALPVDMELIERPQILSEFNPYEVLRGNEGANSYRYISYIFVYLYYDRKVLLQKYPVRTIS